MEGSIVLRSSNQPPDIFRRPHAIVAILKRFWRFSQFYGHYVVCRETSAPMEFSRGNRQIVEVRSRRQKP